MSDETTIPWLQLTLETIQHTPEQLEDALLKAGALAVILQDGGDEPVLEPLPGETPLWSHTRVSGLFSAQTDIEVVKQKLRQGLGCGALPECCMETLEDRDWVRAWMDDYHPMRFGERLWICPTGQMPAENASVVVTLEPGLAFGTGTHPTTALCLEWLDSAPVRTRTVIDYGCGSGILAIAAAKLGASQIWAVDIDSQALLATDQNAANNGVSEIIELSTPENLPKVSVDVLLANILAGPLIALAPHFAQLVHTGGQLVLSGILEQQAEDVRTAFNPWFDFEVPRQREGWSLLLAKRTG